jgi:CBS domain-containing protein
MRRFSVPPETIMHVSDILRVKGHALYTVPPEQPLTEAIQTMVERDIGSLVVMDHGGIAGILTFREVLQTLVKNGGEIGLASVRQAMEAAPLVCASETEIDVARRLMLGRHARYMPVVDEGTLMGVISFHDIAKAVVEAQDFENRMLKAYIRDWPEDEAAQPQS